MSRPIALLCVAVTFASFLAATRPAASASCVGVNVTPSSNIQRLVDAKAARTTFCFAPGIYRLTSTIRTAYKWPVFDLRAGAIIDGQNGSFSGISAANAPAGQVGMEVLGGIFQHFGNAGAPSSVGPLVVRDNSVVEGTEFRENFNTGITIQGSNARVSSVYTHHNGRYGLRVTEPCTGCPGPKGAIIEDSEIAFNNTRKLATNGDAGGTKFSGGTKGLIVRRNKVHDNYGAGLWWDSFNRDAQVYDNVIYNNSNWGILWENSYGGAKFHGNTLTNNALGGTNKFFNNVQLLISCSDASTGGIEIYQNTIDGTAYPLVLLNHSGHPLRTRNVYVHDNVITLRATTTRMGGRAVNDLVELFSAGANNRFVHNTYRVPDTSGPYWAWKGSVSLTWAQWRTYGFDQTGLVQKIA
jgi:parallel beta helix pectate lyase-like protein